SARVTLSLPAPMVTALPPQSRTPLLITLVAPAPVPDTQAAALVMLPRLVTCEVLPLSSCTAANRPEAAIVPLLYSELPAPCSATPAPAPAAMLPSLSTELSLPMTNTPWAEPPLVAMVPLPPLTRVLPSPAAIIP